MRRAAAWGAAGALLAAGMGLVLLRPGEEPAPAPVAARAPAPGMLQHEWIPESRQSYRLELESKVELGRPGSAEAQRLVQRIEAGLHLRVLDVKRGHATLGFQLTPVSYTLSGERGAALETALAIPFVVDLETSGRPREFRFAEGLGQTERQILEEILHSFQAVLPGDARAAWTEEESHGTGRYLAHYSHRGSGTLLKRKTLYTEVDPQLDGLGGDGPARVRLERSATTLRLRPGVVWLMSGSVDEELVVEKGRRPVASVATRGRLEGVPLASEADVALFRNPDATLSAAALLAAASQAFSDRDPDSAQRPTQTPAQRLDALLGQIDGAESERPSWMTRLADVLRADPSLVESLHEVLQGREASPGSRARVLHALELAGTPQAQAVLVSVAQGDAWLEVDRLRAIVALGGVERATPETVAFLLEVAADRSERSQRSVANAAAVAAGTIGRSLGDSAPERGRELVRALASRLDTSGDPMEREVLLKALGNARSAEAVGAVVRRLDDPAPIVRAAAARTLARVEPDGALEMLTQRVAGEPDPSARASLVEALGELDETSRASLQAVHGLVVEEPNSTARFHMVDYLGENLDLYPEADETLKGLAVTDRSRRVRQSAWRAVLEPVAENPQGR